MARLAMKLGDYTFKEVLFSASLVATLLILIVLSWGILSPLTPPILWSIILSITFHPLYRRILKRMPRNESLAAVVSTLVVLVLIAGPITILLFLAFNELGDIYAQAKLLTAPGNMEALQARIETPVAKEILDAINALLKVDAREMLAKSISSSAEFLLRHTGGFLLNIYLVLINAFLTTIFLFFGLRDGARFLDFARVTIPMAEESKRRLFLRFKTTVNAVMTGIVATAAIQSTIALIGYLFAGVPYAVLLSVITFILALFGLAPLVGVLSIVYLIAVGHTFQAIVLVIFVITVATVDNFIRPLIIGGRTHLHPVFLFIFIIGGLLKYGFLGIFLGPIILATFDTVIQFLKEKYFPENSESPISPSAR